MPIEPAWLSYLTAERSMAETSAAVGARIAGRFRRNKGRLCLPSKKRRSSGVATGRDGIVVIPGMAFPAGTNCGSRRRRASETRLYDHQGQSESHRLVLGRGGRLASSQHDAVGGCGRHHDGGAAPHPDSADRLFRRGQIADPQHQSRTAALRQARQRHPGKLPRELIGRDENKIGPIGGLSG